MAELFRRPLEEQPDALREMLGPLQNVMSTVGDLDTYRMHTMGNGFRIDREDPRYPTALRQLRNAGVRDRIEDCLGAAWERLSGAVPGTRSAGTVHVVLVLGNPDDDLLTVRNAGYLGMGGIPGAIQLTIWPTGTSLAKTGYAAAHELGVREVGVIAFPSSGRQVPGAVQSTGTSVR